MITTSPQDCTALAADRCERRRARVSAMLRIWDRIETALLGTLAIAALLVFMYGMVARYAMPWLAPDWADEVCIYLIVWATFLSGSPLIAESRHVSAELVLHMLSPGQRKVVATGSNILCLGLYLMLTWLGIEVVQFALALDERGESTLQIPQAWYYASLPVGMGLMALRLVVHSFLGWKLPQPIGGAGHGPAVGID